MASSKRFIHIRIVILLIDYHAVVGCTGNVINC
nr:MAG TPA: hypothetical protein [Caudoviricetes sp.]DAK25218.1 MAG TPA: hypothetical protein [Caudoviricetes sp.]DAS37401.1 MAG TPA: hypothetical protein [Caudoviricetes sp.]